MDRACFTSRMALARGTSLEVRLGALIVPVVSPAGRSWKFSDMFEIDVYGFGTLSRLKFATGPSDIFRWPTGPSSPPCTSTRDTDGRTHPNRGTPRTETAGTPPRSPTRGRCGPRTGPGPPEGTPGKPMRAWEKSFTVSASNSQAVRLKPTGANSKAPPRGCLHQELRTPTSPRGPGGCHCKSRSARRRQR